jgi:predicted unusual protein kinase regulating ubiquinone biosynthesis (AarF/ABC1/UbiB family)
VHPMSRTKVFVRFLHAVYVLLPVAFVHIRDRRRFVLFGRRRELGYEQKRERAEAVTDAFEELGTTYIKLAQFLTTRPDLVPPMYVRAMERLQDEVPPEEYDDIHALLCDEVGDPDEVYDYFEKEAMSGASIAQVHRAGIDGDEVAVKIRRPGLESLVETDLRVIEFFVPIVLWFLVYMGQESHAESAKNIVSELERTIRQEMNFDREARIMTEIRENIERDGLDDRVIVPRAYEAYSTERVLTMSYEEGIAVKHTDEIRDRGHDVEEIVDAIADAYLHMAFKHDVFHADPHQGNLAVAPDGRAIIYDYGIAQRPPEDIQQKWSRMFMGIGMHEPSMVVDALHDMGALDDSIDRETLLEVANVMIRDVSGESLEEADMQRIERKIDRTLYDYPMQFPQEIILGMRANFGLDGLCADLAPEYDFSQKLFDFFVNEMEPKDVPELSRMGDGIVYETLDRVDRGLGRAGSALPYRPSYLGSSRPLTAFLIDNHRLLGDPLRQPPTSSWETEDTTDIEGSIDDLRQHIGNEMEKSSKRVYLAVLGGTFVLSAAVLHTNGSGLAPYSFGLGALLFLFAWRTFKERETGVMGPKYVATRHRIEQWDDPEEETD